MTFSIDDRAESSHETPRKFQALSADQKKCFLLIKESVGNKSFWAKEGTNTWSLSSDKSMTPTQVEKLQKAERPENVGEFESILKLVWNRDKSEKKEQNRSDATKELYAIIDMLKATNPNYAEIQQRLVALTKVTQNVEVKKGPKLGGGKSDL